MQPSVHLRASVALVGRYPVLAGADLEVAPGEMVMVRGANGSGKTSLLRVLAGLVPLVSGEATVLGLDPVSDARDLRPQLGLLGHRNGLYEELSALENARFSLRSGRSGRLARDAVAGALQRLGIAGRLAELPAGRLSTGQRRRVALACLLARAPRLWLLDEPHAGLDADHRDMLDAVLAEQAAGGATVLFASHEERPAPPSVRTVVMSGGMVFPADGTGTTTAPGALLPVDVPGPAQGPVPGAASVA
jgi:heme ABC exporter ATP-binding subunit CcmA